MSQSFSLIPLKDGPCVREHYADRTQFYGNGSSFESGLPWLNISLIEAKGKLAREGTLGICGFSIVTRRRLRSFSTKRRLRLYLSDGQSVFRQGLLRVKHREINRGVR